MSMVNVSVIILVSEVGETLEKTLRSLDFADEIILIKDGSQSSTSGLVKDSRIKLVSRSLDNDFAAQRNFGLTQVKNHWVLFIDSDEVVSENLKEEISQVVKEDQDFSYRLLRQDFFLGKPLMYGETGTISFVRLAQRNSGSWKFPVHEYWEVNNPVKTLESSLIHIPHKSISHFLDKINFYTSIDAEFRYKKGIRTNLIELIVWPVGKFIYNYILKLGFLDGMQGLVIAYGMSLHSLAVRVKLYSKQKSMGEAK